MHACVCVSIQDLDLMKHRLLRDGKMLWRLGAGKQVEVHVALFTDMIVLMQQQEGRLVLRSHDVVLASNLKIYHGPVIKLQQLIVQPYAAGMYCREERFANELFGLINVKKLSFYNNV